MIWIQRVVVSLEYDEANVRQILDPISLWLHDVCQGYVPKNHWIGFVLEHLV